MNYEEAYLKTIEKATCNDVCITGEPYAGKTTLLKACHQELSANASQLGVLPVMFSAANADSGMTLWKQLVRIIHQEATKSAFIMSERKQKRIADYFQKVVEAQDSNSCISLLQSYLTVLKNAIDRKIIVFMDDFQNVGTFFTQADYGAIRQYTDDHIAFFVFASRESYFDLESKCNDAPYYFNAVTTLDLEHPES